MSEHDIIWGATAIAKTIGKSARATYWLLERGMLPARKIGGQWAMSRRCWREFLSSGNSSIDAGRDTSVTYEEFSQ